MLQTVRLQAQRYSKKWIRLFECSKFYYFCDLKKFSNLKSNNYGISN